MKDFHEKPSHVTTYFLKYNETDVKNFDHVIDQSYKQFSEQCSFSEQHKTIAPATRIGLISLHGCGDLSCTLLDLFMNWSRAETLVYVSIFGNNGANIMLGACLVALTNSKNVSAIFYF